MKKTKDEETVDKAVLQKYHRGRQNRFKVSLEKRDCFFLMLHRVRESFVLIETRVYFLFLSEFERQEAAREAQIIRVTISTSSSTGG